jgi:glycosyltransferase involved in cell wall biosynthesis
VNSVEPARGPRAEAATAGAAGPRVDILFDLAHHPDHRVRRTSRTLAEAGYRVRVLAWDRTGTLPSHEMDGAVEIRRVHVRSGDSLGLRQLPNFVRAVASYVPLLRADRPDVLHVVNLPLLLAAVFLAPLLGRPRIVFDAFEIYSLMESRKYPWPVVRAIALAERVLPRFADLVISAGEGRAAWFAARGVRSEVVANWIDPPEDPPTREGARRDLGWPVDRFTILYAGGIDPSRDLDPLVRHARRVPDDLVVIAGRGVDEPRLQAEAAGVSNVLFPGWVPDPSPLILAADALYYSIAGDHPYAAHAAPNNLYLAISHATPLVHRNQGEIGVVAARHEIGVSFDDDASLDRALDRLRDPSTAARIRASLGAIQGRYSGARAREALLDGYARLGIARSRPTA